MNTDATVFVVDDDRAVRESVSELVASVGLAVEAYGTAYDFLDAKSLARPACLVIDLRLPGMSGLELQRELAVRHVTSPIIMISGYADVATAVRALRAGAVDFLEKPFSPQLLLDRIGEALEMDRQAQKLEEGRADVKSRATRLTARERQVMDLVVAGKTNKVIAADLRLCEKTVEVHRGHVMRKMKAESLAELVRLTMFLETHDEVPNGKSAHYSIAS